MVERGLCTGCGVCAAVCPRGAVEMAEDREGFLYPVVREDSCTRCGRCAQVCPIGRELALPAEHTCFGVRAKEDAVRLLGSSGGVFPLLAAQVLREGGRVWGAAFSEGGVLRHTEVRKEEELSRIAGTKYIQSDLSRVWAQIGAAAREERPALFCGTPCQTDAVRLFLGEDRGGVLLADLICYGVPSPGIWRDYTAWLERRYRGAFRSFSFRDKRNRDSGHTCAVRVGAGEHACPLNDDPYCRTYFRNVNIRPACFHCQYCTTRRSSDITLGDFWGMEQVRPGFDDGLGCSAVICHTEAGRRLWERVRDRTDWFACTETELANERQPRLREPVRAHPKRRAYMGLRRLMPFPLWLRLFRR